MKLPSSEQGLSDGTLQIDVGHVTHLLCWLIALVGAVDPKARVLGWLNIDAPFGSSSPTVMV